MEKIVYPKKTQSFFIEIIEEVKLVLDPDFIIIAGSFGKDAWLYNGDKLLSDFEFEFICYKKWSIKRKKNLVKKLNEKYPYDISLTGHLLENVKNKVSSNYSNHFSGYVRLDFFDAFSNPQILYAKNESELNVNMSLEEVPAWEAWRLYVNRIGDILSLKLEENSNVERLNYYWLKIFESTADVYLLVNKIYSKNISVRYELFKEELLRNDTLLNDKCLESYVIVKKALYARKEHKIEVFDHNALTDSNKMEIVNSWLEYLEEKVIGEEGLMKSNVLFSNNYLNSKFLQKKYLEVNSRFAIPVSNGIRFLFHNKELLKLNFKFYNLKLSWRHLALILLSELYKEQTSGYNDFSRTRNILANIISKKELSRLSDEDLLKTTLKLWKILR